MSPALVKYPGRRPNWPQADGGALQVVRKTEEPSMGLGRSTAEASVASYPTQVGGSTKRDVEPSLSWNIGSARDRCKSDQCRQ